VALPAEDKEIDVALAYGFNDGLRDAMSNFNERTGGNVDLLLLLQGLFQNIRSVFEKAVTFFQGKLWGDANNVEQVEGALPFRGEERGELEQRTNSVGISNRNEYVVACFFCNRFLLEDHG